MFTRITIYFLLVMLNFPLFSRMGIVVYFQANKAYIAKVLCVNKNKSSLHCNGKCYLAKKLKATEEREQKQTAERLEKMPEIQLFCSSNHFNFNDLSFIMFLQHLPNFHFLANPQTGMLKGVFHPPQS
ncbi:hypothetical protein [Arcicella rosea]|uniref:Uncharacterized protein n=1 Tax=Arcicella rosea TaxID=502909 RepID=A0A841ETG2_9BACT|nr:hypothetical protein [Arcicella rosea]MBB6003570.1 hypothetical protein [Arcicella rosea]